ncbi:MAG: hypothetical protein ACLFV0_11855 [Nitriliruptoraceae bacterium]
MDPHPGQEDPDGPPPLPPEAVGQPPAGQTPPSGARRRRRWPLLLAGLLLGLASTLVAVALTGEDTTTVAEGGDHQDGAAEDGQASDGSGEDQDPSDGDGAEDAEPGDDGAEEDGSEDAEPGDDGAGSSGDGTDEGPQEPDLDPDDELDPLDLADLGGQDLLYGRLLTDIDASERQMLAFQTEISVALAGATSRDEGLAAIARVAATREEGLLDVRERLADPVDDPGAEEVRRLYVEHLDSWAELMGDVAEEPLRILDQSERGATVAINRTADRFSRALEAELPDDIDAEVERFAEDILDRGFRGAGTADV